MDDKPINRLDNILRHMTEDVPAMPRRTAVLAACRIEGFVPHPHFIVIVSNGTEDQPNYDAVPPGHFTGPKITPYAWISLYELDEVIAALPDALSMISLYEIDQG